MHIIKETQRFLRDFGQFRQMLGYRHEADSRLLAEIEGQLATVAAPRRTPGSAAKRLVVGLTAGYDSAALAPFVRSLREHGYGGEAMLVTFATPPATRQFLEAHGVSQVSFDTLPLLAMSMNSARMFRYLEFLRTFVVDAHNLTDYDYIMLSDVRDVVFQGDPFARVDGAEIYYFLETGRTIGTCPINSNWMKLALGAEVLRQTADSPVSCAGTLIATPAGLMRYLLHMCRLILMAPLAARYSGIDQAIHNYIMVNGLVDNPRIEANGGAVITVPTDLPHGLTAMANGMFQNADGTVSEIVHQYDRDPVLAAVVAGRYGV